MGEFDSMEGGTASSPCIFRVQSQRKQIEIYEFLSSSQENFVIFLDFSLKGRCFPFSSSLTSMPFELSRLRASCRSGTCSCPRSSRSGSR